MSRRWLSLLLWKPVAVVAGFWAARSYARRSLSGLWARRSALVLCLFFGCFTVIFGSFGVLGDLFPGFLSWGYTFGLIALAAMVGGLLTHDRASRQDRIAWTPGLLGATASLLHPWQGEALIALVLVGEGFMALSQPLTRRRVGLTALTVGLTAAPLIYYVILTHADLAWHLARQAGKHSFPLGSIVIAIAPLILPALLAYRNRPKTFLAVATRAWPVVAFGVYFLSGTGVSATPLHAFQGITFPMSILAIEGLQTVSWGWLPRRRVVVAIAIALATIPATGYELYNAAKLAAPTEGNGNFITRDERDALKFLAKDPEPGGVITQAYLGAVVPGVTGRGTLLGDCAWSEPDCQRPRCRRQGSVQGLTEQAIGRAPVARDQGDLGARRLQDHGRPRPRARQASRVRPALRLRCGLPRGLINRPPGALAQSRGHAAVRAARRKYC